MGQINLYVFGDIRPTQAAARFNKIACCCLDVRPAYPHPITPAGHAVEGRTAISVGCPQIHHAPVRRNQLHPQCRRGPVVLLVTDANGNGGKSTGSTSTHSCRLLRGTCRAEKGQRQSQRPKMTRPHDCPLRPLLTQKTSSSCGNIHSSEIFCEPIAPKRTNYRPTWNEQHRFAIPECRATVYFPAWREPPIPNQPFQTIR